MAGSEAFELMKRAVLQAARFVPQGRVTTAAEIGRALNIPARHVVYILAMLTEEERQAVPAHRVVPRGGKFGKPEGFTAKVAESVRALEAEGTAFDQLGAVMNFDERLVSLPDTFADTRWDEEAAVGTAEFFGN